LEKIEKLLNGLVKNNITKLEPIHCHDIICYSADAVISGGVRRSALIALFDKDDQAMMTCKTGDWFVTNKQRARANNSAVLVEGQFTKEEFMVFKKYIQEFGEPGFIIVKSDRFVYNPCAEIGFYCYSPVTNKSGFSFCNLNEINGAKSKTPEILYEQAEVAAFIGTLQAAYDKFDYLGRTTEEIVQYEALLGVSITGWMNSPDVLFKPEVLEKAAQIVLDTNEWVADLIGINACARGTCVKPSGNSSVILGCASGIHPEHSKRYFRLMQINKESEVVKQIKEIAPSMVEHSIWSSIGADDVIYVPIEVDDKTIFKKDVTGVDFLDKVKIAKAHWVDKGKRPSYCLHPDLSHNVSNTVTVDNWDEVFEYVYENREYFSGISFMASIGDKAYNQAPFTEVLTAEEILAKYGDGAMFASGLIVDGLDVFENLWDALNLYVKGTEKLVGKRTEKLLMKDWIRRVKQFSKRYLKGDLDKTIELLLDVNNWHRWHTIKREMKKIDFDKITFKPEFLDVADLTSNACYGGACEIPTR
jgi:ribonucleoside-diphosphate reductase alpha chain